MNTTETVHTLALRFGGLREDYSGRGMFGATCLGVVTRTPRQLVKAAATLGLHGHRTDSMGISTIVYWPQAQR